MLGSSFSLRENGSQSSSQSISDLHTDDDESDLNDPAVAAAFEQTLLEDDFLGETHPLNPSKHPEAPSPNPSTPSKLKLPHSPSTYPHADPPLPTSSRIKKLREQATRGALDVSQPTPEGYFGGNTPLQDVKDDGGSLDWFADGFRRQVGYDDLTAIDWVFEYTKERQRLRIVRSQATSFLGYIQQFYDASQVWLVLVAAGIASGVLAASIDVASDWLADLKTGYCKNGPGGGQFYLNKGFCCWGHTEFAQCSDWTPWGKALHANAASGRYVIEYIFFLVFSVAFAGFASLLVKTYAGYAKHSGIPEIKTVLGGFVIRHFMGAWTLIIKSLGLCLAVASGLWLGKEGPLVHVACCCANLFMKLSKSLNENEARKREVLSAAAAAGISVAFGSPIGGVLFSLEQLSYYFPDKTMWQSFVCAMVAAVTLQAFNPFRTGQLVLYQVTYSTGWHNFEMVPFAVLGVLGGIYGGLFIKLNMFIAKWRRNSRLSNSPVLEVVIVALITALINFPNKFMRAQSSEMVYLMFAECSSIEDDIFGICRTGAAYAGVVSQLWLAAILGFILASVTFGLRIPAGIILPSMAIGSLYGRALGILAEIWQKSRPNAFIFANCERDIPCITPGTYAIIGAASALGGVTRMTVSIVVIMFELTGALTYVLPIMIAVMISKWVGDAFGKKGIYESWIHFNEYPFLDHRDDASTPDVPTSEIMTPIGDLATLAATGQTIQNIQEFLSTNRFRGFPVVADRVSNTLIGYVSRTELNFAMSSALSAPRHLPPISEVHFTHHPSADPLYSLDLRPWMDQTPMTLDSKSTLQLAIDMFQKLGLKYVLFCNRGALQGLLTKKDIWYVLNSSDDNKFGAAYQASVEDRVNDRQSEERGLLTRTSIEDSTPNISRRAIE